MYKIRDPLHEVGGPKDSHVKGNIRDVRKTPEYHHLDYVLSQ